MHVRVGAGRRGHAEARLECPGRRGVADPRRVVDVVGSQEARHLLRDVVRLVGQSARGEVERDSLGCRGADSLCGKVERLLPSDPVEPELAAAAKHRVTEPSELAQRSAIQLAQRLDVPELLRVQRRHRVELEQVEASRAEVDAVDRPVVEAGDAECAAVADAFRKDVPRVLGMAPVLPGRPGHLPVVVRLLLVEPVWHEPDPQLRRETPSALLRRLAWCQRCRAIRGWGR